MDGTRIVVGVDGSAASQEALRWAAGLGEALGAEVVAIHALGLLDRWHDPEASARSWRRTLCALVERTWCSPLARSRGTHRVEVRDGDPVDALLAAADDEHADLLVVGSRGVGGRPELALGSTSLHVLQAARVPVLVVPDRRPGVVADGPGATHGGLRLHHLLVGVDRSQASRTALELAADVAAALGGSLSVLEVVEYVPPFPLDEPAAAVGDRARLTGSAMALLEAEVRDVRARGVGVQVIVRSGDPAATLLEVADDVDADLIAVGTRGRGGPDELLLGSVARTVADRARRPTLVVPATAGPVHLRGARRLTDAERDAEGGAMEKIKEAASEFLANKRIAVTGVSRNPGDHGSNVVYRRLRERGYEVFAVNPNADEVEGDACYHDLKSIPDGVDAVVIATRPETAEATMRECDELGIAHVWMHRSFGTGSVSKAAADYGRQHGIKVIDGGCPLMFAPAADAGHRVMRVMCTLTGKVPRRV